MKLALSIDEYVSRKHAFGYSFWKGEANLKAFSRQMGDVNLDQIDSLQVLAYLDSPTNGVTTWRQKYFLLSRFFEFWFAREKMPQLILPPAKVAVRQAFMPHVFSRTDLRKLFGAAWRIRTRSGLVDRMTRRTLLLFLYATGALVGEALELLNQDVDLRVGSITIGRQSKTRSRQIPIGVDLREVLQKYLAWRSVKGYKSPHFFITAQDMPITQGLLRSDFQRLRREAGIIRRDGGIYQPRLNDLKFTFAVHRITSWIRSGADLNRMLLALAAYMGQVDLGATERYLAMSPERFRKQLNKLSPARGKGHWRNDKNLMKFLSNL